MLSWDKFERVNFISYLHEREYPKEEFIGLLGLSWDWEEFVWSAPVLFSLLPLKADTISVIQPSASAIKAGATQCGEGSAMNLVHWLFKELVLRCHCSRRSKCSSTELLVCNTVADPPHLYCLFIPVLQKQGRPSQLFHFRQILLLYQGNRSKWNSSCRGSKFCSYSYLVESGDIGHWID